MNSDEKAEIYFNLGKVSPIQKNKTYELWAVNGNTGLWNVRYDTLKSRWDCDCPNVRLTYCSHIKACIIYRRQQ